MEQSGSENLKQGSLRTGDHAGEIRIFSVFRARNLFYLLFLALGSARLFLDLLRVFRALSITLRQGRFTGSRNERLLL